MWVLLYVQYIMFWRIYLFDQYRIWDSHYIYCIVLYWSGGHCCPMHCDLFKIYCAPPNIGITKTWICWLNFAQMPIFSGLRLFNEPEISTRDPSLKSLPEDLCSGFLRPEKIHRPQPDLSPRTVDLEASTLPRDHRGRQAAYLITIIVIIWLFIHSYNVHTSARAYSFIFLV